MSEMIISGGHELRGKVCVSGSKNAVLPILAASLLTNERIVIKRVPDLEDVRTMLEILHSLEIETVFEDGVIEIKQHKSCKNIVPYHLIRKMRASFNILGPLSVMNDSAQVPLPGGCSIGPRPVDMHLMGLKKLGFDNHIEYGVVFTEKARVVKEAVVDLPFPSVGATEQILSTAVKLEGTHTILNNAAKEPEISQLVDFLIGMGANIEGKGTSTLKINGVKELHGLDFEVIYDRMEAGTYLIAGLMTGGEIEVEGYVEQDNLALSEVLNRINAPFKVMGNRAFTHRSLTPMTGTFVKADVYPWFPTDMQPQITALLTLCQGQSVVQDVVFPERNSHAEELRRFGAEIFIRNQSIMINGVDELEGAPVMATDLRCAAALILTGLTANGDTLIQEVDHIFRGYDKIVDKLRGLGAVVDIK